jgi:hypothetical protein
MLSAAVLLAGCASHYPYSGGSGVYYGKSHDRHGYGYKRHYGHTGYQYNYYRHDYVHRYVPWWSGYGSYYHGYRRHDSGRHHDSRDDHHHERDTADRSGDAARELQRVTDQQRRRALLNRSNSTPDTTVRSSRSAREPSVNRSAANTNSVRGQLRRASPNTSDQSSGSRSMSPSGNRSDSSHRGGVRTPRERDR